MLDPYIRWKNMNLSSLPDIACTKLLTINMRGNKKDYIDLYFLLDIYSLSELFDLVAKKYGGIDNSQTHILKSLVYFDDAEDQPIPRMHKKVSWDEVKMRIASATREIRFN